MPSEIQNISPEIIEKQLKRIQDSPLFSHSRRYPCFLDYVVRKTLQGHQDELKERTIGVEAFGRPSGYDLNADPIVRVTAGEVRKRLAQYYYEPDHQNELRIELRPGSYIPEFRFGWKATDYPRSLEPASQEMATLTDGSVPQIDNFSLPHLRGVRKRKIEALFLGIAISLATVVLLVSGLHTSTTGLFWRPILDSPGPVLISVGSVVALVNQNVTPISASSIGGHPLSSDPISLSDAVAVSSIQQMLSQHAKASSIQSSAYTSFSDLQKGPIVLVSGFDNPWTMRLTNALRFHFVRTALDNFEIQDRTDPTHKRWAVYTLTPFTKMTYDYGIIARFHDPTTEQIVVVAAGIGENGTIAAGRMISDGKYLAELKQEKLFPRRGQNFEAVIETQVIDGKPGPPRVVAANLWR